MNHTAIAVFVVSILTACTIACGGDRTDASGTVTSPVHGLLLNVIASADGDVAVITLRTNAGDVVDFPVQLLDEAFVSADHLREHIARDWPVTVSFTSTGATRTAYRIDDG